MLVTELYTFNLTCVILLMALYGVAFTFKPQARRLRNHLETLKQADPVFYAEARKSAAAYRSEVNCAEI